MDVLHSFIYSSIACMETILMLPLLAGMPQSSQARWMPARASCIGGMAARLQVAYVYEQCQYTYSLSGKFPYDYLPEKVGKNTWLQFQAETCLYFCRILKR